MKKLILTILATMFIGLNVCAQQIERKGDTFYQKTETPTKYKYVDKDSVEYQVFLNDKGKAFIKKLSPKTGKWTRKYVHEVGKVINPDAYKDDDKKKVTKSAEISLKSGKPQLKFGLKG